MSALLTTSAIVTAVIGLALQETLGNIFSGLSLQLQKPFEPGDWIRFDSHLGRVQGIGWRSTSLITRNLEILDVPNGLLARAVVTNYRGDAVGDEIFIGASYKTPPNVTKRVILEVLREVPDVVAMPPPVVEVEDYGDFAIKYRIHFWMRDYGRQERVRDAIITSLWYALPTARIEIPFPIRDVYVHQAMDASADADAFEQQRPPALRQVDFLADLDDSELDMLRSDLQEAVFGSGEIICREGRSGRRVLRAAARRGRGRGAGRERAGDPRRRPHRAGLLRRDGAPHRRAALGDGTGQGRRRAPGRRARRVRGALQDPAERRGGRQPRSRDAPERAPRAPRAKRR